MTEDRTSGGISEKGSPFDAHSFIGLSFARLLERGFVAREHHHARQFRPRVVARGSAGLN
jgi:hypothetical protein